MKIKFKILIIISILILILLLIAINSIKFPNNSGYYDKYITVEFIDDDEIERVNELNQINFESNQLMNLTNFKFIIENELCSEYNNEFLGVLLITSYVGHDELRSAHRQAITQRQLKDLGFLRVFLLADIPKKEKFITQGQVYDENLKFGDLIQGNFEESYKNLTYKHLMGLKWAAQKCKNAKFIIKIDDDIVFDIFYIQKFLKYFVPNERYFMGGYVLSKQKTIRNQGSKWYVPHSEYVETIYPDYLSGWLYITNPETCSRIVKRSYKENFFWIDDIFVSGIIREKLNIKLIKLNEWYSANSQFLECCLRDSFKFSFECDYYVGPNGGETKMIIQFTQQMKKCYLKAKLCRKRPENKSLKRTCVAEAKNLLEREHGEPVIRAVRL